MGFLPGPARNRAASRTAMVAMINLGLAPAMALAAPAAAVPADVVIDCQQIRLPSQRAVAALLQIDNFGQAYRARARLMEAAKRACHRPGVARVRMLPPDAIERRNAGVN
ncbi:MAG TPA: hypothetical protein VK827_03270 [Lysobacter sp.]|nr:hypothetical protein [Lysobacter sp.]